MIQPKVKPLVDFLNSIGFKTTDSGDGVTNVEAGMECALDFPHVVVLTNSRDLTQDADLIFYKIKQQDFGLSELFVQGNYSPNDGIATIIVSWELHGNQI